MVGHAPILAVHAHLGHVEMVALLLEMWAPVDGTTDAGMTPLCLAAAAGHVDIVSLLCKKGAKVRVASVQRGSELHTNDIPSNPRFVFFPHPPQYWDLFWETGDMKRA